jgi:hypothetical protein
MKARGQLNILATLPLGKEFWYLPRERVLVSAEYEAGWAWELALMTLRGEKYSAPARI